MKGLMLKHNIRPSCYFELFSKRLSYTMDKLRSFKGKGILYMEYILLLGLLFSSLLLLYYIVQPEKNNSITAETAFLSAFVLGLIIINNDYGAVSMIALFMTLSNVVLLIFTLHAYKKTTFHSAKENVKLGVFSRIMLFNMGEKANSVLRNEGSEARIVLRDENNNPVNLQYEYDTYISELPIVDQVEAVKMVDFVSEDEKRKLLYKIMEKQEEENRGKYIRKHNIEKFKDKEITIDDFLDDSHKDDSQEEINDSINTNIRFTSSLGNTQNYDEDMSKFNH